VSKTLSRNLQSVGLTFYKSLFSKKDGIGWGTRILIHQTTTRKTKPLQTVSFTAATGCVAAASKIEGFFSPSAVHEERREPRLPEWDADRNRLGLRRRQVHLQVG
jgi:hypothetical protein